MINIYVGLNGQGKTLYINNLLQQKLDKSIRCISNLNGNVIYTGIDKTRADIITSVNTIEDVFDYSEVIATNNHIASIDKDDPLSEIYTSLVTLLARPGDVLILDEPDLRLTGWEIVSFISLLEKLRDTYDEVHMVVHNQRLLSLGDKYFWVENYKPREISKDELYGHIGRI